MVDDRSSVSLASYALHFLTGTKTRLKPRTWEQYEQALRNHVLPAFGAETPLPAITRSLVCAFIEERLGAGYHVASVRNHVKVLQALLSSAVDEQVLDTHPAMKLGRLFPRRPDDTPREKAMPRRELAVFLRAVRQRHAGLAPLFLILARCGLRLGEALALRWADVDLERRQLHVRHSLDYQHRLDTPKSGKARVVDLSRDATACLATLHAEVRPGVPWVFASPHGRPWCRSTVRRIMLDALDRARLPDHFRPHALRHSFGSLLADAGVSPWEIRDLMGHHSVAMTERYVHVRARHLRAVNKLDGRAARARRRAAGRKVRRALP